MLGMCNTTSDIMPTPICVLDVKHASDEDIDLADVSMSLRSPDGAGAWTLTVAPAQAATQGSSLPWLIRLHDPEGCVRGTLTAGEPADIPILRPSAHPSKSPSQRSQDKTVDESDTSVVCRKVFAPLRRSENRWDPRTYPLTNERDWPFVVDCRVKGLLNKLTMAKFDSLSDQIIAWANKSETEKDGRTFIQVIRLVFETAINEAAWPEMYAWSEMYARLCRKMMEQISPKVQDDGIKNAEGKPITGGQLFRKYLLNRCQEDFEPVQAASANKEGGDNVHEPDLYSDDYYAAQKAKRQGLGLIRFIGELFKLQMLTERNMHQCVQKLLGNVENPEEEEIESVCTLFTTVGELLDTPRAHAHMDVYFARMKEMTKKPSVNSRMQFMLQDLIELRGRGWRGRTAAAGPATIAQIHELVILHLNYAFLNTDSVQAAKEKAAQEKETMHRQSSMSRGGSRRGGEKRNSEHVGPDGWTVAGSAPRPPAKAGDLSKFGTIRRLQ
ncbi:armadillo-type protein [Schizophyllum amplum]|uniref:Armadillo-type protein n=1 Tax=Schizophyllum amplum TaxID=97359 RepID=A0A550CW03_9AGAR|nr:armadillo-type protein [Auriculariopsis ampla]